MCSYFYIAKNSHKYIERGEWGVAHVTLCVGFYFNVLWVSLVLLGYSKNALYLFTVHMAQT